MLQKLTVSFLYQKGAQINTNQLENLQLGTINFSFEKNLVKLTNIELAKFQLCLHNDNVFRFTDPKNKTKDGPIQKFIELHLRESSGKYNATTGLQEDLLAYIPISKQDQLLSDPTVATTTLSWQGNFSQYIFDSLKSPLRESVTMSKGNSSFNIYITSQENDLLDLTKAEYIYIEFDVYYY